MAQQCGRGVLGRLQLGRLEEEELATRTPSIFFFVHLHDSGHNHECAELCRRRFPTRRHGSSLRIRHLRAGEGDRVARGRIVHATRAVDGQEVGVGGIGGPRAHYCTRVVREFDPLLGRYTPLCHQKVHAPTFLGSHGHRENLVGRIRAPYNIQRELFVQELRCKQLRMRSSGAIALLVINIDTV